MKHVANRRGIRAVVASARALTDGDLGVSPLVVSLLTPSVSLAAKGADAFVKVAVSDVMGGAISIKKVNLKWGGAHRLQVTLTRANAGENVLLSNQELHDADGAYAFNLAVAKPDAGVVTADISVSAESGAVSKASVNVKVTAPASVPSLHLAVKRAGQDDSEARKFKYPPLARSV